MKKNIIYTNLILCLFFTVGLLYGQAQQNTYTVIRVKDGIIKDLTQKSNLIPQQKISESDLISFESQDASAFLTGSDKKIYQLSYTNAASKLQVKNLINPVDDKPFSGVRSAGDAIVTDLVSYLGFDTFYVIGDELKFRVSRKVFGLNNNEYLALKVNEDGKAQIVKIPVEGNDTLVISKNFIEQYYSDETFTIYKISGHKKYSEEATIALVFIAENELIDVFKSLEETISDKKLDFDKKLIFYNKYFDLLYGYTDQNTLLNWLKENKFLE